MKTRLHMVSARRARMGHAAAFTLIEIMMVVAIIGLTLTMGFPAFHQAMNKQGMGKAESDLVKACQEARRAAIMNNKTVDLVIRPLDHTISVPGAFDTVEIPKSVSIEILGVNFVQLETADEARVHFYRGSTSDEFTIVLHDTGGIYRRIDLDVVTALPTVSDLR